MTDLRKLREAASIERLTHNKRQEIIGVTTSYGGYNLFPGATSVVPDDDAAFIVALVNAFDNGDLIPREEADTLRAENERLRDALEWYADKVSDVRKVHGEGDVARMHLSVDSGDRARAALNPEGEE